MAKQKPRAAATKTAPKTSARSAATESGVKPVRTKSAKKPGAATAKAAAATSDRTRARKPVPEALAAVTPAPVAPSHESAVRGKYVYCIIRTDRPVSFGAIGIGQEPAEVYTVAYRDLAAVVSDTALVVHDPTRENVLAHQGVAETVMRGYTVIPMSFGTVFKTREDIVELLRSAEGAFRDVLEKMQDRFEFGLKVLWDRDQIVREIEREDENVRRLKDEISAQKGSTYFARMQYGRLVDATLQSRTEQYVSEVFHALRDVAVASRTNKPIGDKMILNAAFLVSRDQEQAFDARVKEIGQRYDGRLTFKYTGPWPPYNFVNIRLKLERAQ
ncbi:GvpL/GvpF family gas vesicle protein [Sandaracinus amylolyticus]|uniref:Putative gas vesicle synthesis protein n=1 Tax=Sandaracinus amylolyticus TaxID=927083 RepID=A0A0F6SHC3_9BACT|nr:GvpL/GvpF family gas vesicle protein [Sandaracinus amylolyticus]AKF10194.1 Putative gas vesicle synthesis protein [Sandaracinus amylolyticus]